MSANPVAQAPPAVTTPVHVSPTFSTYRSQVPSSPESARSPVQLEGLLSEEDYLIPTIKEEEMAEGLSAALLAGMSLQDPFGSSNPTQTELEDLSSPGLLRVKVRTNSGSRGQGQESRCWPRLGITPGARETDWVQRQRSSIDPLHRFRSDRGIRGWE